MRSPSGTWGSMLDWSENILDGRMEQKEEMAPALLGPMLKQSAPSILGVLCFSSGVKLLKAGLSSEPSLSL